MKILYYDCFAGISGDMNLGAMIDLGVDPEYLKNELQKLNIKDFHLEINKELKNGISGTKAIVVIENPENVNPRYLKDIEELINKSSLPQGVKKSSLKIFNLIARAEAKVHGINIQKVHFHEVGALDSIVDIVGAAICIDYLKIDKIISSPVQLGGGTVKCTHGTLPVPAPATSEILQNIPVKFGLIQEEATTPTGAAILVALSDEFTDKVNLQIKKTAYGIGQRDNPDVPNVLRVHLAEMIEPISENKPEHAYMLECNIDDMNPEWYEILFQKLLEAGARDVFLTPIIMKKSRPANKLSVLCQKELIPELKKIIFLNSTTIGIREYPVTKTVLARKEKTIQTELGEVRIKLSYFQGKEIRVKPEMDDCEKISKKYGISLNEVLKMINKKL